MTRLAALVVIAASMTPASAGTLYCSTWQGIRTCSSPDGYLSRETEWQGRTYGDDSDGARWTSWRWQDREITTMTPPPDRR
jgi:hypothetical protein